MTITEQFIVNLNNQFDPEGRKLINDFFMVFSRFECALKTSIYANTRGTKVEADWNKFTKSIKKQFDKDRTEELSIAANYILISPPQIQVMLNGQLSWSPRQFPINEPEINRLGQHIRD